MTAQPLAPVIPSSAVPAARQRARSAGGRPLPLARPVRSVPQGVVYGIARIDASGRICERAVITALGWAGGDRLTLTADAGVVTARRDPAGMVTLPASGYITIPAALRRRCGLEPGDQVLLAALPAIRAGFPTESPPGHYVRHTPCRWRPKCPAQWSSLARASGISQALLTHQEIDRQFAADANRALVIAAERHALGAQAVDLDR